MNHPNSEEWALYVSAEVTPERRDELSEHLNECASCAAEAAALQRSARRLAEWQFPEPTFAKHGWAAPAIKWGVAAAMVLGFGFALGRFSSSTPGDAATMRADIERSVKASLAGELRSFLDELQAQPKEALASMEKRLGKASDEQMTRVVRNVVAAVNSVREEDRHAMHAMIDEVRQEHEQEIRRVRLDLETVATQADDRLRLANFQLRQLTAKTETDK